MKYVIKGLLHTRKLAIEKRVRDHRKGLELMSVGVVLSEDVESTPMDINGVPAIWFNTPESRDNRIVVFFHGGAYIAGSPDTSKFHAVYISRVSKAQLLSVDYRLAPENPFPAGLDDAVKVYKWLIEEKKFSPEQIVLVGVSAGGGLTLAALLKLRELGIKLPAAAVCISPWADLAFTGETYRSRAKLDPFTSPNGLDFAAELYIGENDPKNPLISPVYAKLNGLPSLFIIVGTAEILHDDSIRLANNAKKEGVEVTLEVWEDMIHAFPVFVNVVPESCEAIDKIGNFIRKHLN
jgi:acetyl esterase/lipase